MPSTGPQPFAGQEKRLRLLAFVRQDSVIRVDKRVEDTAMVWPHLLVIEFIVAMLWLVALFVISALFNAPLQDRSTVDCTPNPSKAPWYLLNLQELLLHMDKGLAGVVVPPLWFVFMAAIPYIDRSRDGIGHIRIVVAVAGRGLDDRRFVDARLVHGGDHLVDADGPQVRPIGLMAAKRRQRVALLVVGDDVRMNVDRLTWHRVAYSEV